MFVCKHDLSDYPPRIAAVFLCQRRRDDETQIEFAVLDTVAAAIAASVGIDFAVAIGHGSRGKMRLKRNKRGPLAFVRILNLTGQNSRPSRSVDGQPGTDFIYLTRRISYSDAEHAAIFQHRANRACFFKHLGTSRSRPFYQQVVHLRTAESQRVSTGAKPFARHGDGAAVAGVEHGAANRDAPGERHFIKNV